MYIMSQFYNRSLLDRVPLPIECLNLGNILFHIILFELIYHPMLKALKLINLLVLKLIPNKISFNTFGAKYTIADGKKYCNSNMQIAKYHPIPDHWVLKSL